MAERARAMEVKVGALILVAIALLVGFMLLLGDVSCEDRVDMYVDLPNSGDLKTGAPVKINGVTVGKVAAVDLWGGRPDPDHANKRVFVRATIRITTQALAMLHTDARFQISTVGVLGEKYVEIDPGTPDKPNLTAGALVDGKGGMRLDLMGDDATILLTDIKAIIHDNRDDIREIVVKLRDILGRADEVIVENREDLREVVANLKSTSAALARATGNGDDIRQVITNLNGLIERLDKGIAPTLAEAPVAVRKFSGLVDNADRFVAELAAVVAGGRGDFLTALANIRLVAQNLKDGKGTVGAILSDREIYDDVVAFLKDVKRHPWKLLMKD